MIRLRTIALAFALLLGPGLGPLGCGGGGAKVEARSTTLGQELQDLDAAYQKGLLTKKEYDSKRKSIMKRY